MDYRNAWITGVARQIVDNSQATPDFEDEEAWFEQSDRLAERLARTSPMEGAKAIATEMGKRGMEHSAQGSGRAMRALRIVRKSKKATSDAEPRTSSRQVASPIEQLAIAQAVEIVGEEATQGRKLEDREATEAIGEELLAQQKRIATQHVEQLLERRRHHLEEAREQWGLK